MGQYKSFSLFGAEARFYYDDGKVNRSKELIKEAEKALDSTKENIAKGFSSLLSAANIEKSGLAENIRANEPVITKFPEECVSYMEELYKMVESKQGEIEDYKAHPVRNFFATIGMAGSKLIEGIASVGENIVDAGATLVGCVGGIFNSDFQDSCAEFIKKDHVGDAFHDFNQATGLSKYSAMSENGTMAKVFKGIGVATGYVAIAAATGGTVNAIAGAGTMTATAANTAVAVVGGLGSGMESGLQQGKDWDNAFKEGVKTAAIQGATAYAAGKLGEKLQTNKALKADQNGTVQNAVNETRQAKEAVIKAKDELAKTAVKDTAKYKAAKLDLKKAKIDYHTARANQSVLEKGVISGDLTKANEQMIKNNAKADKLINNINIKDPKTGLVKRTITRTTNVGHSVEAHVGDAISTRASGATDDVINAISKKTTNIKTNTGIGKTVTDIAGKASDFAGKHPVAAAVVKLPGEAAVGVAKASVKSGTIFGAIPNEMDKMDNRVMVAEDTTIQELDRKALETIGKEEISYPTQTNYEPTTDGATDTYNPAASVDTTSSANDSNTSYQPNVTARQTSVGSSGGYYPSGGGNSGGGSTYTPSYPDTTPTPSVKPVTPNTTPDNSGNTTPTPTPTPKPGTDELKDAIVDPVKPLPDNTPSSDNTPTGGNTPSGGNTPDYVEPVQSTTSSGSSGTTHSGGGYSDNGYSFGGSDSDTSYEEVSTIDPAELITGGGDTTSSGTLASSITSTNKFKNQTIKIPTTSESIESSGSNYAIPTAAAFSAAAAAGIGAKAYIDKKQNTSDEEEEFSEGDENNGVYTEEWDGSEDDIKIDYGTEEEQTLDDDDDYSYSADSIIEKYEAVNNSDLEEVQ